MANIEIAIRLIDPNAVGKKLEAIVRRMGELPSKRQAAIEGIIHRGLIENHRELSAGKSVVLASGRPMFWTREVDDFTAKIRRRMYGLDSPIPMLHFSGRLEKGLAAGGTFRAGARTVRYRPNSGIVELLRVHQKGLAPLPDRRRSHKRISHVPQRETVFWSKKMAQGILRQGRDLLRSGE